MNNTKDLMKTIRDALGDGETMSEEKKYALFFTVAMVFFVGLGYFLGTKRVYCLVHAEGAAANCVCLSHNVETLAVCHVDVTPFSSGQSRSPVIKNAEQIKRAKEVGNE